MTPKKKAMQPGVPARRTKRMAAADALRLLAAWRDSDELLAVISTAMAPATSSVMLSRVVRITSANVHFALGSTNFSFAPAQARFAWLPVQFFPPMVPATRYVTGLNVWLEGEAWLFIVPAADVGGAGAKQLQEAQ